MKISAEIDEDLQSLTVFAKTLSQKSDPVPSTCNKIAVRKFPIYKQINTKEC